MAGGGFDGKGAVNGAHAGAHGCQPEAATLGVGGGQLAGVEACAVVDYIERDVVAEIAEVDLGSGGVAFPYPGSGRFDPSDPPAAWSCDPPESAFRP